MLKMKEKTRKTSIITIEPSSSRSRSRTPSKRSLKNKERKGSGKATEDSLLMANSLLMTNSSESTSTMTNVSSIGNGRSRSATRNDSETIAFGRSVRSTSRTRGRKVTRSKSNSRSKSITRKPERINSEEDKPFLQQRISSLNKTRSNVVAKSQKARRSKVHRENVSSAWQQGSTKPQSERCIRQSRIIGLGWRGKKVKRQGEKVPDASGDHTCRLPDDDSVRLNPLGPHHIFDSNEKDELPMSTEQPSNEKLPSRSRSRVLFFEDSPKAASTSMLGTTPNTDFSSTTSQGDESSVVRQVKRSLSTGMVYVNGFIEKNVKPLYNDKQSPETPISVETSISTPTETSPNSPPETSTNKPPETSANTPPETSIVTPTVTSIHTEDAIATKNALSPSSTKSTKSERSFRRGRSRSDRSSRRRRSRSRKARRRWKREAKKVDDADPEPSTTFTDSVTFPESSCEKSSCEGDSSEISTKLMQSCNSGFLYVGNCFDTVLEIYQKQRKGDVSKTVDEKVVSAE